MARVNITYRFADLLTGRISGSWSESESESNFRDSDEEVYSLTSSLTCRILERTIVTLSYEHRELEEHHNNSSADRNLVFAGIATYWENLLW